MIVTIPHFTVDNGEHCKGVDGRRIRVRVPRTDLREGQGHTDYVLCKDSFRRQDLSVGGGVECNGAH